MARRSDPMHALGRRLAGSRDHALLRPVALAAQQGFRRVARHLPAPFVRRVLRVKARLLGGHPGVVSEDDPMLRAVFDEGHYRAQIEVPSSFEPFDHYRQIGWRRGLDPTPLFDVSWYLSRYPEVAEAATEPVGDYVAGGWKHGRDPAPWFSAAWYLDQLERAGEPAECPLLHYVERGCALGFTLSEQHAGSLHGPVRTSTDGSSEDMSSVTLFTPGEACQEIPVDALAATSHRLITFDVWDTLIRRTRPADAAKVATARRMRSLAPPEASTWDLFEARVAMEREFAAADPCEEYLLPAVLERVLANLGVDAASASARDLARLEVRDEVANTYRVPAIADLLAELQANPDKDVAILSDFYVGAAELADVLRHNAVEVDSADILASCEIGASKRLGTAFAVAQHRAGVRPGEHLHVGDNPHADVDRALEAGVSAALCTRAAEHLPPAGGLTVGWYRTVPQLLRSEAEALLMPSTYAHRDSIPTRAARAAGAAMAVLVVAQVSAAIDAARRRDVPIVHYLSREGAFLAEVHRRVGSILVDGTPPRAVHLEVSRRSTFGPSLDGLDEDSLLRIARQYPEQSLRGLLRSLGVDPESLSAELARMPVDPDRPVDVARSSLVHEFLERPAVRRLIEARWADQRALLSRYLEDRELGERSVVVDVGWRGTIQDNLCALRPDARIHGVYLGLFPFLNPQPLNATKEAVAFDGNRGELFAFADPPAVIESPLTPPIATSVGYVEIDGRVEPVRAEEPGRADDLIVALQSSLLAVAPRVAERLVALGASPELLRAGLCEYVSSLYADPPPGIADIWFESAHDDTFGAANLTPYGKARIGVGAITSKSPLDELEAARASRWVAGYTRWTPVRAVDALRELLRESS